MTARVSPTERIRAEIDDLFATEGDLGETLEQVARLGARLLLQSALEAEVTEFLGRNRYERRRLAEVARAGSRNGFAPFTVKSTAGPITLERPKLRGTEMAFASRLLGAGVTKTNALESLVIAGFVRGLSVRDVEATLAEALGPEATVSRSTVSRICEAIKDEFDRFKAADLSEVELEYLFVDGSVRHEAPCNRAVMKGHRLRPVAAGRRSWGQPDLGGAGKGGKQPRQRRDGPAPPDDPGPASETGRCTSAETSGGTPSSERHRLEPGGSGPGSSARSS